MTPVIRRPKPPALALCAVLFLLVHNVLSLGAWETHALLTRAALAGLPDLSDPVAAEELESFLAAERAGLPAVLEAIERRAAVELPAYSPPPPGIAFDPGAEGAALRESFLRAIRVNPRVGFPLCRQPARGEAQSGRPVLPPQAYTLVAATLSGAPMEALAPGEVVSALDVVATASDEPDYGMDVGLYTDNEGPLGALYGFGPQPFGNPTLSYGSQAPFHMAFPWEDPVIALAAPFSQRSQAAYRELQFTSLARFAFERGHAYWGWRFAGWAMHYIEDLSQPYHARMIPGQSTFETLTVNAFGSADAKAGILTLLSNRHLVLELYAREAFDAPGKAASRFEAALAGGDRRSAAAAPYRSLWLYDEVARGAYAAGPELDALVVKAFPAKYVADPAYDFGLARDEGRESWLPYAGVVSETAREDLDAAIVKRYAALGASLRTYAAIVCDPKAPIPPRSTPLDLRGPLYVAVPLAVLIACVGIPLARRRKRRAAAEAAAVEEKERAAAR